MVNHCNVPNKVKRCPSDLAIRHRHSNYLSTFFIVKMAKYEKYRVLLTSHDLPKNVKN